jgi:parallel beta-helix repeat protein
VIDGNTVRGNGGNGIGLSFNDANNFITNNTIDSNRGNGFRASFASDGNVVQNNTITNNGQTGIAFSSGKNTATGNTVTANGTRGQAGNDDGIFLSGGSFPSGPLGNDVVSANVVMSNAGNGIRITCTVDENTGACDNVAQSNQILNNTVHANGGSAAGTQLLAGNGFLIGVYDLLDGNNSVNDAATSPAGTAPDCDSNTWSGNYNGTQTGFPACTEG